MSFPLSVVLKPVGHDSGHLKEDEAALPTDKTSFSGRFPDAPVPSLGRQRNSELLVEAVEEILENSDWSEEVHKSINPDSDAASRSKVCLKT